MIEKIRKRDGRVVEFDRRRVEHAILKASLATNSNLPVLRVAAVSSRVVEELEAAFSSEVPTVEDVQDLVEKKLVEANLYKVAKAFILYRRNRSEVRVKESDELLDKVHQGKIQVTKRDGSLQLFDLKKINLLLENIITELNLSPGKINLTQILELCQNNIFEGITTKEINQALLFAVKGFIEKDVDYSQIATKILFSNLYKDVLGVDKYSPGFEAIYHSKFEAYIKRGVALGRLDPKMLLFDLKEITGALKSDRDGLLQYLGAQTLYDRYFLRDNQQQLLEVPQFFWMRVAMGLALDEPQKEVKAIEFYNLMSQLLYLPSTPTLFHSGTTRPQMSSCYLTTVEDNLSHIFKSIGDNAQLSKWSGGVGNDWTNIRATGAQIKSINVGSQGVIPFLKIVDSTTAAINRSGKRRGATCVYLETWHLDIEDFIDLRRNTGDDRRRTHDTNTANWIPDLFMIRVKEDADWTLFSPEEVPDLHRLYGAEFKERYEEYELKAERGEIVKFKKIKAKVLWQKMITQLYETGHPWITFKDACNVRSPQDHVGVVCSSNLCTEITLNTSESETAVCNLGSVNVSRHVESGKLNWDKLAQTVKVAIRMLDNVIDLNFYPIPEAKHSNLKHRPIGLGMMGLQDALYLQKLNFASDEAVNFSDRLMEYISYHAFLSSSDLAKERGAYPTYKGSKWSRGLMPIDTLTLLAQERGVPIEVSLDHQLDWQVVRDQIAKYGLRNSNCLAIAPTATIANISGCFPSIEPAYKNIYTKSNFSGEFTIINQYLIADLKKLNLWNDQMLIDLKRSNGSIQSLVQIPKQVRAKYLEVFEMDALWIVKHAAVRSKWLDQSQSVNIFTKSTSGLDISKLYQEAWVRGLKTTYYLRTLGATSIEKSTISLNKDSSATLAEGDDKSEFVVDLANPSVNKASAEASLVLTSSGISEVVEPPLACVLDDECESCQ